MEKLQRKITSNGFEKMGCSTVTICSIVRDCNRNLKKNISVIEELRKFFKSSNVIVFENDSIDGTKETLSKWERESQNVNIYSENYSQKTIPKENINGVNRYYSEHRMIKMTTYRNNYLRVLNNNSEYNPDFVILIDLDIGKVSINGIAHSFGLAEQWDVVCANGYFYDAPFRKKYYDSYALVEIGNEKKAQTEESISQTRNSWSFLRPGMPLIPVYSAFGGLAIYRFEAIKGQEYRVIKNNDKSIEVRVDHFSLFQDIRNAGFTRIFINPAMTLNYFRLGTELFRKIIKRVLLKK